MLFRNKFASNFVLRVFRATILYSQRIKSKLLHNIPFYLLLNLQHVSALLISHLKGVISSDISTYNYLIWLHLLLIVYCIQFYTVRNCIWILFQLYFYYNSILITLIFVNTTAVLTFIGPYIVMYFYSKTNEMHRFLKFILFCSSTLHVSDGLSV